MRGLFLTFVYVFMMLAGVSAPFVAMLGYLWVDLLKPQELSYTLINSVPISMIAATLAVGMYFIIDRKFAPRFTLVMFLIVLFAAWVTMTTTLSELPDEHAWRKWDWVIKVLIMTIFMPYVFRSRIQIEAFILVIIFSASSAIFSAAVKTMLGSGGYGSLALLGDFNSGLAEGSTLATFSVMLIPLMSYMRNNSLIFKPGKYTNLMFTGLMVFSILTVVGTSARTGLIGLFVLLVRYIWGTKKKMKWLLVLSVFAIVYINVDVGSTKWGNRMSTIETYNSDSSALGRLAVWKWTLGYALDKPLGGGFNSFRFNRIWQVTPDGIIYFPPGTVWGKAFHSIYFEVLGEQGYFGLLIYLSILGLTWRTLSIIKKQQKANPGTDWASSLSKALLDAMLVFLVCGAFIGIAYQPYFFYIVVAAISLNQYVIRHKIIASGKELA